MHPGRIEFAKQEGIYFFKLCGEVSQNAMAEYYSCVDLAALLERLFQEAGVKGVLVDCTETEYIDSTHLGLLAQMAVSMQYLSLPKPTVLIAQERIKQYFTSMGLSSLFCFAMSQAGASTPTQALAHDDARNAQDQAGVILKAHRALVDADAKNKVAFQDLIRLLEKEAP